MEVLYDYQAFTYQNHGGVSRCFAELHSCFQRHPEFGVESSIGINETDNVYLRAMNIGLPCDYAYKHFVLPFTWPFKHKIYSVYSHLKYGDWSFYWNKYALNRKACIEKLQEGNFDIFHATFFDDYFLPFLNGKPYVITIHDMIPELYPQFFNKDNDSQISGKRKLALDASAIIAVSENTKRDIVNILNIPEEKVHVVYHGCSFPSIPDQKPLFDFPYILYVGQRPKYKNFSLFVCNMKPVLEEMPDLKVVCTGIPFSEREIKEMEEMRDRYIHFFVPSDEEFYSLYHYAECFVYPSEYEGFGIPILEAYKADCPVLLNNASCFPEIAGDAAIYFEMGKDYSDFTEKIKRFLGLSKVERLHIIDKQRERLEHFSWEKSAEMLSKVYKSIV